MRIISVLILLIFCGCYSYEDIVLKPDPNIRYSPSYFGFSYRILDLPIDDNRTVSAWHVLSDDSKAIIVVVPGSDANKGRYAEILPLFVPEHFDVILMDYIGYGESKGEATFQNTVDSARVVFDYAVKEHQHVIGFSVSLGTPCLARLAVDFDLTACIFEGTFVPIKEPKLWMVDNSLYFPLIMLGSELYTSLQIPDDFDIEKHIQNVHEPKLFIHSFEDEVTPYGGGLLVYNLSPDPKEFWTVRGSHGRMVFLERELYKNTIVNWIDNVLKN